VYDLRVHHLFERRDQGVPDSFTVFDQEHHDRQLLLRFARVDGIGSGPWRRRALSAQSAFSDSKTIKSIENTAKSFCRPNSLYFYNSVMQSIDSMLEELHRHGFSVPAKPERELPQSGFHALDQEEDRIFQSELDAWSGKVRQLHATLISSRSKTANT
jgi:hypothetical protein